MKRIALHSYHQETDSVIVLMWKNALILLKMHLMKMMKDFILTGVGERPDSWRILLLQKIPKISGAGKLGNCRMIALSSTLCKWLLRKVVALLQKDRALQVLEGSKPHEVLTYGFPPRVATSSAIVLARESLTTALRMDATAGGGVNAYTHVFRLNTTADVMTALKERHTSPWSERRWRKDTRLESKRCISAIVTRREDGRGGIVGAAQ